MMERDSTEKVQRTSRVHGVLSKGGGHFINDKSIKAAEEEEEEGAQTDYWSLDLVTDDNGSAAGESSPGIYSVLLHITETFQVVFNQKRGKNGFKAGAK